MVAQFQGDRVARHARFALAVAHVDLHQFEQVARLFLQRLVFHGKHRLPNRIFGPAEHIPDRQVLAEQALLVDI